MVVRKGGSMKNLKKVLYIGLYKQELEIIERIQQEQGIPIPELIRTLIREYGAKTFPKEKLYAENKKRELDLKEKTLEEQIAFEKMDPKEYAINELHAEVDDENGVALFINPFGGAFDISLNKIKTYPKDELPVNRHLEIINGTYVHSNGLTTEAWSQEKCNEEMAKWRAYVRKKIEDRNTAKQ